MTSAPAIPLTTGPSRFTAVLVGAGLVILTLTAALAWQLGRQSAPPPTLATALPPPAPVASLPAVVAEPAVLPQPAAPAPAPVVAKAKPAPTPRSTPVRVASPAPAAATLPTQQTDTQGNTTFDPAPAPARVTAWACPNCGVVDSVTEVKRDGDAQGVGAVAGGVLGGLIGSQIGGGNGKRAATVVGAIGGGIAGHQVEKKMRAETSYDVRVRMDDGTWRTINQTQPASVGTRVSVEDGMLRPAPVQEGVRS
ncbi:MAG: glycine zipper 2TM domain-containing protein [Proteobacteria bacterium]|nr:glycine zipper 2TM domain-containing protein [Pseudomonadota bacterium]